MSISRISIVLILALVSTAASRSMAQHSRLEPRQPRWGQTVTVTYDPASAQAKLRQSNDLYLVVEMIFPLENSFRSFRMKREGSRYEASFEIPSGLSALRLHFLTLDGDWDQSAFQSAAVLREDGKPARGAAQSKIIGAGYGDFFREEVALYPDNYLAYRSKWSVALDIEGEKAARSISADLAKLERIRPRSPELTAVLAFGYGLFSEPDKSRELIRTLVDKHPDSPFSALAISDFELRYADQELDRDRSRELNSWKISVMTRAPAGRHARQLLSDMADKSQAPLELSELIAGTWMKDEPDDPRAPLNLALACAAHYRQYDLALRLTEKAIDLLIAGRLRFHGDISGARSAKLTGQTYLLKADLLLRSGKYDAAITTVKVARTFDLEPRFASHLLEARILWAAGRKEAAESAYLEAFRRGSQEALERLRTAYQEKSGRPDGFEDYLAALQKQAQARIEVDKRPLPNFRATTLGGSTIDLNRMQGRIVVVNLWFIACGPCRREIPALNSLAEEFKGKNVVFLAPSPDSPEALRDFLARTPFNYQIIPDAEELIQGVFQAASFPTHLVINRDGQVEARFIGGGGDRPAEVRRELLRLLNGE